ncbi:hypothetical protein NMG60_11027656 [Bertholletia excelsa]
MADMTTEVQGTPGLSSRSMEEGTDGATPDVNGVGMKFQRAQEAYKVCAGVQDKPTKVEVVGWFFYGLCSYSIHTVLVPIVFPIIISQIFPDLPMPKQGWEKTSMGLACKKKEMQLFEGLTFPSIKVNDMSFSPLEWTSISWVLGVVVAAPVLATISVHLDHGHHQQLIAAAATATGAIFCLPAGFFKTTWIFPPYIAFIIVASAVAAATHTRHLGLMVRGFAGPADRKCQLPDRTVVAGWLSLYATAAGCLGAAVISAFTYHMLRHHNEFLSLWVVSIFSGLKWFAGIIHVFVGYRPGTNPNSGSIPRSHVITIFNYPHAAGTLAAVLISSFATMSIFTGGVLHLVGQLCFKPVNLLFLLLIYFIVPLFSLPLIQPLQQIIKADAVRMQLLGFFLSTCTSGIGFYYHGENWTNRHVLILAAVQSVGTGLLHSFGRVLLLDCSPAEKEGAFAAWFSWARAVGTCAGFAVASAGHGGIVRSFGAGFFATIVGMAVLIFGNVSSFGGAVDAGHLKERREEGLPARGLDWDESEVEGKLTETANVEAPP